VLPDLPQTKRSLQLPVVQWCRRDCSGIRSTVCEALSSRNHISKAVSTGTRIAVPWSYGNLIEQISHYSSQHVFKRSDLHPGPQGQIDPVIAGIAIVV